jgi:hypothetical protein
MLFRVREKNKSQNLKCFGLCLNKIGKKRMEKNEMSKERNNVKLFSACNSFRETWLTRDISATVYCTFAYIEIKCKFSSRHSVSNLPYLSTENVAQLSSQECGTALVRWKWSSYTPIVSRFCRNGSNISEDSNNRVVIL